MSAGRRRRSAKAPAPPRNRIGSAAAPALTNQRMAAALGLTERHLQRLKSAGLPVPAPGQSEAAWLAAATAWRDDQARHSARTGPMSAMGSPTDPNSIAHWTLNFRKARALKEALELQQMRGLVHAKDECDREKVAALHVLRGVIDQAIVEISRTCAGRDEAFLLQAQAKIYRAAFDNLQRQFRVSDHATIQQRDAGRAPVAGPDDGESVGGHAPTAGPEDLG